jgi:hypothetical protein
MSKCFIYFIFNASESTESLFFYLKWTIYTTESERRENQKEEQSEVTCPGVGKLSTARKAAQEPTRSLDVVASDARSSDLKMFD